MATLTMHNRKLVTFAVLAAAAALAMVGYLVAQGGKYSHIYSTQPGDDRVVAVVSGTEVTWGQIRKTPAMLQETQPGLGLSEDQRIMLTIVGAIDRYVLLSEVNRRGLMPTEEEARQFLEPHKQACLGPQGEICRQGIADEGKTVDEYWNTMVPRYQEDLGVIRLAQAHLAEIGLTPDKGTNEERAAAMTAFDEGLRAKAGIEWKDQRLALLYREALSPEGQNFNREQYQKANPSK